MKTVKINNIPSNIGAYVVGNELKTSKNDKIAFFIFGFMILGTILINYKYSIGKI